MITRSRCKQMSFSNLCFATAYEAVPNVTDRKVSILVVDDDESVLNILVLLFDRAGYNVLAAKDGESA